LSGTVLTSDDRCYGGVRMIYDIFDATLWYLYMNLEFCLALHFKKNKNFMTTQHTDISHMNMNPFHSMAMSLCNVLNSCV
jgi:hypothetical protein